MRSLLTIGMNIKYSYPKLNTSAYRVSNSTARSSKLDETMTRARGCMIRLAWSERFATLDNRAMLAIASLRRNMGTSFLSTVSITTGNIKCIYSSTLGPNVPRVCRTARVVCLPPEVSVSKVCSISGTNVGRKGLNSSSRARAIASTSRRIVV